MRADFEVELRVMPRARDGADVNQQLDAVRLEHREEVLERRDWNGRWSSRLLLLFQRPREVALEIGAQFGDDPVDIGMIGRSGCA